MSWRALCLSAALASLLVTGCRKNSEPLDIPEYAATATIKDIMLAIVDPSADEVWNSTTVVIDATGIDEKMPRTEEEWTIARHGALKLAEATNLLLMPGRHVARPGEKSETPGVELEPEEMDALIAKDRTGWNERVEALHAAAEEALHAIDARDAQSLFDIGDRIEAACEHCHATYWYPNQVLPPGYEGYLRSEKP
jgi:hypothetical protein